MLYFVNIFKRTRHDDHDEIMRVIESDRSKDFDVGQSMASDGIRRVTGVTAFRPQDMVASQYSEWLR